MGTNYYLLSKDTNYCPHCGRSDPGEVLHIGKSSGGWVFALHVIPEREINSPEDWLRLFNTPGAKIQDEYGHTISPDLMMKTIKDRKGWASWDNDVWWRRGSVYSSEEHFHSANCSERGPNGLLRSRVYRNYVSHGEGTWDCIVGEFS